MKRTFIGWLQFLNGLKSHYNAQWIQLEQKLIEETHKIYHP